MNRLYFISLILFAVACNPKNHIHDEDLMVMHFLIERTSPDTVKKYINYYVHQYDLPQTAREAKDGEYTGASPYDDYGYKHVIHFTIRKGQFTNIAYDEVKSDGHSKATDTSYCRQMNDAVMGSAPNLTYPNYIRQLSQKQNLSKIDGVTGATYSLYRFRYAAMKALLNGPAK